MCRVYLIAYIVLMFAIGYWASDSFRQEQAKVKLVNTKYITDVVVFTGRKSRHDPYLTNMTGTTTMPYGNNVSVAITLSLKSGGDFRVASGCCDALKSKWMHSFLKTYTNLTIHNCPFPAAKYVYVNMELPPKNIPIPIANGDYAIKYDLYITATKEPIVEVITLLHYDQNAKKKKGKGK